MTSVADTFGGTAQNTNPASWDFGASRAYNLYGVTLTPAQREVYEETVARGTVFGDVWDWLQAGKSGAAELSHALPRSHRSRSTWAKQQSADSSARISSLPTWPTTSPSRRRSSISSRRLTRPGARTLRTRGSRLQWPAVGIVVLGVWAYSVTMGTPSDSIDNFASAIGFYLFGDRTLFPIKAAKK